jgi:hypothetical protein
VVNVEWTAWARARLRPYPGDSWQVAVDLKKAESKIKGVPAAPTVDDEVARAIELGVNERYDTKGNLPRDTTPSDLVDILCARAGVAFATEVVVRACSEPQRARPHAPNVRNPYAIRHDGQPWGRLREHLAAAPPADRAAAHAAAATARARNDESRQAVAYALCDPTWVAEDTDSMFARGYGTLALLAAQPDAATARDALARLLGKTGREEYIAPYQIVEEAFPHLPTLMLRLADDDASLVVEAARRAWNTATRKPWLEIVACIQTDEARAFLAEHGYTPKPPKPVKPANKMPS